MTDKNVNLDVLEFINNNRQLDVTAFYEKMRKSYNDKHSKLYINIMRPTEEPDEVLTTLSALLTQILIFANKANDRAMFLRHVRAEEITKVLTKYFNDYDLIACNELLGLFKADIKALETTYRKDVK